MKAFALAVLLAAATALPASAAPYPPVKAATAQQAKKKRLPANHDLWLRIGRCEQPGSGYGGVNWSHHGPTYQGGLGFWYGTWASFKVKGMPANAGDATWRQQMWVANRLYARYGVSPWGCG